MINKEELTHMLDDALSKETSKSWREKYKEFANTNSFKEAYDNKSIGEIIEVE